VRGSNGIDYKERIKIMKLLWDAIGHRKFRCAAGAVMRLNDAGNHGGGLRMFPLQLAQASGARKGDGGVARALHGRTTTQERLEGSRLPTPGDDGGRLLGKAFRETDDLPYLRWSIWDGKSDSLSWRAA
jgi:hypothetical protein